PAATIYAGPPGAKPARIRRPAAPFAPTATINVTYTGFTPQAQAAFEYAATIWEGLLVSGVTIEVQASWEPLGTGILGSAGPSSLRRDFAAAPQAATWYPIAIANKLAGTDLDGTIGDINARFSSNFPNWYFGTDGNTPAGQYDFASVVLHELGHGLGFVGSMRVEGANGYWGGTSMTYPYIYDRFAVNGAGQLLIAAYPNNSSALAGALTGNSVFFNGASARAANGGANVPLYAPTTWNQGSSYSHLAESFNGTPNELMTYSIGTADSIHDPGPVTLGMFRDMGWSTAIVGPQTKTYLPFALKSAGSTGSGGSSAVVNGNFDGAGGWTENSTSGTPLIGAPPAGMLARSGSQVAKLGGRDDESAAVAQTVTVPAGSPSVSFWYQVRSEEDGCTFDLAALRINGTEVWSKDLCAGTVTGAWTSQTVNLGAYAGQTVTLRFAATTDSSNISVLVVDDVTVP
ncbi:MAG TPA: hypothetical protein VGE07_18380, partial [Herpetosiphonaceae bacterium]